jgi:hypothetical protein
MMKSILLTIFTLISFKAYPDINNPQAMPDDIETIISNNLDPKSKDCIPTTSNKNTYQQCLSDICGNYPEFESVMDEFDKDNLAMALSGNAARPNEEIIIDKIEEYFDLKNYNILDSPGVEKKIKAIIKKAKKSGFPNSGGILAVAFSNVDLITLISSLIAEEGKPHKVNRSVFKDFPLKEKNRLNVMADKIDHFYNEPNRDLREISPIRYLKKKYPKTKTGKEAVAKYLSWLITTESHTKKDFSDLIPLEIDLIQIKSNFENDRLTHIELKLLLELEDSIKVISLLQEYKNQFGKEISKEKVKEVNAWIVNQSEDDLIDIARESFDESEGTDKDQAQIEYAQLICASQARQNMDLLPTENQIKELTKVVENSKLDFVKNLKNFPTFSTSSLNFLTENIKDLNFVIPYSDKKWEEILLGNLNHRIKELKRTFSTSTVNKYIRDLLPLSFYLEIHPEISNPTFTTEGEEEEEISFSEEELSIMEEFGEDASFPEDEIDDEFVSLAESSSAISQLCMDLEQTPFSDRTMTAFGNIMLSYTLVRGNENYQRGTIYHEMSHNLMALLDQESKLSPETLKAYKKAKNCLGNIHNDTKKSDIGKYYSEDFADYVAVKMLPNTTRPIDCELLTFSLENNEYTNNNIQSLEVHGHSPHSSELFRVLRAQVDANKKLPKSCNKALETDGIFHFPKSCKF